MTILLGKVLSSPYKHCLNLSVSYHKVTKFFDTLTLPYLAVDVDRAGLSRNMHRGPPIEIEIEMDQARGQGRRSRNSPLPLQPESILLLSMKETQIVL
jgi:hypothetical protein